MTDHGASGDDLERLTARREEVAARYLRPADGRPASSARGVHHVALFCADVERTVVFYEQVLGFPLIEMFENRDYRGSTHFFFDIGHGNTLAFFDLPGVEIGPYAEVFGGLQHLAISISQEEWEAARDRLDAAGIPYQHISGTSLYFLGPDGERLELLADPLRWMYGKSVG